MAYHGQPYGAPPGQPPYAAPPGQPAYGAPPGQPAYGAPPGYGAPQVDPAVLAWFQAVDADRSGQISALELQQVEKMNRNFEFVDLQPRSRFSSVKALS